MKPKLWHHILTGLSVAVMLTVTLYVAIRYGRLPDQIPTHFGPDGSADAFGHKSAILFPVVLGWFVLGLVTLLSFFPDTWNTPNKKPRTLEATADMLAVLRLVMGLMFAWMTFCSAQGRGLGSWFLPATLIAVFGPLVYLLAVAAKK